jgi:putative transcriptional regulator
MRKELFDDLIESVNEAVAIKRGLVAPARVTTFEMPDVKAIRTKAKLKQNEFAQVVGVSFSGASLGTAKENTHRQQS